MTDGNSGTRGARVSGNSVPSPQSCCEKIRLNETWRCLTSGWEPGSEGPRWVPCTEQDSGNNATTPSCARHADPRSLRPRNAERAALPPERRGRARLGASNLPRSCPSETRVKAQEAPSTERRRRDHVPRLSSESAQATAASRHPVPMSGTPTLCPRSRGSPAPRPSPQAHR